jgi:AcrR family transcriptional regulator
VSRSSFYWYFKNRHDLLDALLAALAGHQHRRSWWSNARAPAGSISEAACNFFHCVIDARLFNHPLDFAVRDWARRSAKVRGVLDRSDATRVDALAAMFARFGYPEDEALTRARVLYFMQVGYDLADLNEPTDARLRQVPMYLYCFTGQHPKPGEIEAFAAYAQTATEGSRT